MKKISALISSLDPERRQKLLNWFSAAQRQLDEEKTTSEVESNDFNEHVLYEVLDLKPDSRHILSDEEIMELDQVFRTKNWSVLFNN